MNCQRWVLVEAWLTLGLRVRWQASYEQMPSDQLFGEDNDLWYAGHGEWVVVPRYREQTSGRFGEFRAPEMSTDDMAHELAHWLIASPADREKRNFGDGGDDMEERAVAAEKIIDAIASAANRVVMSAMRGGSR